MNLSGLIVVTVLFSLAAAIPKTATLQSIFARVKKFKFYMIIADVYIFLRTREFLRRNEYIHDQEKLHDVRGATFKINGLLATSIYTINPNNIRAVFSSHFDEWGVEEIRLPSVGAFIGPGIHTLDGHGWKEVRSLVQIGFQRRFALNMPVLEQITSKIFKQIPQGSVALDIQPILYDLYFESSYHFFINEFMDKELYRDLGVDSTTQIRLNIENGTDISRTRDSLGIFRYFTISREWYRVCGFADKFADLIAAKAFRWHREHPAEHATPPALCHRFTVQWQDKMKLRYEVQNYLATAPGTVPSALVNLLHQVSQRPEVWDKIREEVLSLGDQPLSPKNLLGLQYMQNVLDETLRLYPANPFSARVAKVDTVLPGGNGEAAMPVRKGTRINSNILALHRVESVFGADPNDFRPDRWNEIRRPAIWEYMPFSRGPRACLGKEKGLVETKYLLARLAQDFQHLDACDTKECLPNVGGRPVKCPVRLTRS